LESSCLTPLPFSYISPRLEQPLPSFKSHEKACGLNNGTGCFNLGLMYEEGRGVRKSNTKALKYYGKACDLELALGCKNYAGLKK
jgi:TPR repeat protein